MNGIAEDDDAMLKYYTERLKKELQHQLKDNEINDNEFVEEYSSKAVVMQSRLVRRK